MEKFETHTDSGYGTHGTKTIACSSACSGHPHGESAEAVLHEDNNDTATIYSDTTSLQDPRIDDYVTAFADELANALPADFSREELEGIEDTLPDILEAFAGRIGYQAPGKLERQLKHLVHRYRIRIIHLVQRRLSREGRGMDEGGGEDADLPDPPRNTDAEEDFRYKVSTWLATSSVAELGDAVDANCHDGQDRDCANGTHQHTKDEEPIDIDELPDLPKYRQALCQSPAYQWLLSSFMVQRALFVPGEQRCMRTKIRKIIIENLRPEKRLSRRDLGYNAPLEDVLARAVTITGHGNDVQVATCLDYMTQTWPETGASLLNFLQDAVKTMFRDRNGLWSDTLPGGTVVCACLEEAPDKRDSSLALYVEVHGNIFAIAELGEQLAWLGAALRSAPTDLAPASCTPNVRKDDKSDTSHASHMMTMRECAFELTFDLNTEDADSSAQGACWRGLFRNPVIVRGFPIPRGESRLAETGAQIPLDIAGALINSNKLVKWAGTTYLQGFSALLAATKVVGETVVWHLVYNSDGSYISYEDPRVPRWAESADPFVVDALNNYRHVVGWCDRVVSHAGAPNVNYRDITWSGLPGPNQSCALEKVTISGGQFINAGISCVLGLKDKPVHINYGDDYYGILQNISDRYFVFYDPEDRQAWLLDGASTALPLLQASIKHSQDDKRLRKLLCSPDNIELDEVEGPTLGSRAEAAWEVLSNQDNMNIPLRLKSISAWDETTIRRGEKIDQASKEKKTYLTVGDRIEQICHVLCQITAHYDDVQTQSGVGFRLRSTPRPQLEGFDFTDIATGTGTLWPRVATLKAKGRGWVDFTRAIHAPTLFASGFGELFTPFARPPATTTKAGISSCAVCLWNSPLPKGEDYLAATTSDLQAILRRRGNMRRKPWRLVENIHWYSPDLTCEPCSGTCSPSGKKGHDRVQVLLPGTFPGIFGRESPRKLPAHGAVVFGHSSRFPLIWGPKKGDPPDVGEPEEDVDMGEIAELSERFEDSGIGTSIGSSRSPNAIEGKEGELGMVDDGVPENPNP
ncbi:hypothetical protein B0I37DRAFT_419478 [Chaetomium sp. MPI-CAGE-AT-0009]|nr:hypothetical protein B0I37DRAFT_419478 [Chaetomium sp. MPI-CAGE-AT-0009]